MAKKAGKKVDPLLASMIEAKPRKGDLRKMEIIQASIRCMARVGIEGTTFDAIAKEIGTHRAHVAYYYKDKSEIIFTAIQYIMKSGATQVEDAIEAQSEPRAKMRAYVRANFDWIFDNSDFAAVAFLFFYYCRIHERYRLIQAIVREEGVSRISTLLELARGGASPAPKTAELRSMAEEIQGLIMGLLVMNAASEGALPAERRTAMVDQVISAMEKRTGLKFA